MLRIPVELIHHKNRERGIGLDDCKILVYDPGEFFQTGHRFIHDHFYIRQQCSHQLSEDRIEKHLFRPEIIVHGRTADTDIGSNIAHFGRFIPFPDKHSFRRFYNPAFHVLKFFCTHRYNVIKYFIQYV